MLTALSENSQIGAAEAVAHPRNPDAFIERFPGTVEITQLGAGAFEAFVSSHSALGTSVDRTLMGPRMRLRVRARPGTLLVAFPAAPSTVAGCDGAPLWRFGELLVVDGEERDIVTFGKAAFVWLTCRGMQAGAVAAAMERRKLPSGMRLAIGPERNAALRRLSDAPGRERAQGLVPALLRAVDAAEYVSRSRADDERYALVRRVERYMDEYIAEPLSIATICSSLDCRPRTLIYAFNAVFGMGPIAFLKIQRLNRMRRLLVGTDSKKLRILDLAGDCGLWHLGHFGTAYKTMFGLTPSATRLQAMR